MQYKYTYKRKAMFHTTKTSYSDSKNTQSLNELTNISNFEKEKN